MASVNQELNSAGFSGKQERALRQILNDYRLQLAALTAKLDADAGVTDTTYTSVLAARSDAVTE